MSAATPRSDIYAAGDICGLDGSYQVVHLISKGGMGEVYRVVHRATGRHYALKRLQFRHQQSGMYLDKIKAEAAAGKEMKHPNLCPVYESALDEMGGYFVMELLDGETLSDRLKRGALPPLEALHVGAEIADALHALHLAGIFHRDVKPANIFLTRDGRVMLLDLGAAKFERYGLNTTQSQQPIGTALFMSPEHAHNKPLDGRSDIFSLGHVLYCMLTGGHAYDAHGERFATANAMNIVMMHTMEECPPLTTTAPHLPKMLWDVVRVAVQSDRERRYETASSFAATMRGAAKVLRGEAETSSTREAAARPALPVPAAPTPHVPAAPSPAPAPAPLVPSAPPARAAAPSVPPTPSPAASRIGPKGTAMMMSAPERFDAPSAVPAAAQGPAAVQGGRATPVQWGPSPAPPQALPVPPPPAPVAVSAPAAVTPPRDARPSPPLDDRPIRPLFPQDYSYQAPRGIARSAPATPKHARAEGLSNGQKLGIVIVCILGIAAVAAVAYAVLHASGKI